MDLEGPSYNKVRFNVQMCKIKSKLRSKGYTGSVRNPFLAANCMCCGVPHLYSLPTVRFACINGGRLDLTLLSLWLCSRSKMSSSSLMGVPLGGRNRWWTMRWVGCFCMISPSSHTLTQIDFLNFPQTPDAAIFRIISYFLSSFLLRRFVFLQTTNINHFLCAAICCYNVKSSRIIPVIYVTF